jgi:rare lipoprotein A
MTAYFPPECCKLPPVFRGNLHARLTLLCTCAILALSATFIPARAFAPERMHEGETQRGIASWYGAEQGHHTASGERFNPHAMTAAHRHLPFSTIVLVTNELNGLSVELRINDRGPWRHGRIIDVTDAAADILQMKKKGTVPVTVEVIKLGPPTRHAQG